MRHRATARYASAFPALIGNGGHQPGYLIGVAQETIPRVVETLVELEDIRHGGREVELRNRLVRNAFQVLDDAAQAVAVGRRPGWRRDAPSAGRISHFQ